MAKLRVVEDIEARQLLSNLETSVSTSASKYPSSSAIQSYVSTNGGKIDTIKVNGTAQSIVNKVVDISVPTNTNQLTNGAGFITSSGSISGNAATATKATQDGSGNTITSTYVKKSGDTMTGNLKFGTAGLMINDYNGYNALEFQSNYIQLGYGTSTNGYNTYVGGKNLYLRSGTGHSNRMIITEDGNVGIGTESPDHKLHVSGGVISITANGQTLTVGALNTSYTHFMTSGAPFYFNEQVHINGNLARYNYSSNGYGTISGYNLSGNASTATKLATARTFTIGATGKTFDGSANVSWTPYEMRLARALYNTDDNLNDFAQRGHAFGMCSLGSNGNVDNPGGKTGWHHVINMTWTDTTDNNSNATNEWCTQIANACGSTDLYVRSRKGGSIANGTAWAAPWVKLWKTGDAVTGAVWNDYAEYRESDCTDFGYVLTEKGDDTLTKTTERLQHFAGVSSDTWGFSQGETETAKTPIAVAGRVLVYPYQDRNNYKPGDCVCAALGGTVDIMSREEVRDYPDRIVGTVSCVPDYAEWGGGEIADRDPVKVNGRIWIKVR